MKSYKRILIISIIVLVALAAMNEIRLRYMPIKKVGEHWYTYNIIHHKSWAKDPNYKLIHSDESKWYLLIEYGDIFIGDYNYLCIDLKEQEVDTNRPNIFIDQVDDEIVGKVDKIFAVADNRNNIYDGTSGDHVNSYLIIVTYRKEDKFIKFGIYSSNTDQELDILRENVNILRGIMRVIRRPDFQTAPGSG